MNKIITILKISIYGFLSWVNIDQESFNILIILMTIDSFVGVIKAIRVGGNFSFKKLLWGFCLKLCFLIIPLIVALLAKTIGYNFSSAVNVVITILSVSEGYSALGNIYSVKNRVEVKRVDIISMLLKSLRLSLMSMVVKGVTKIEKMNDCKIK